jgi:hypothetical protein
MTRDPLGHDSVGLDATQLVQKQASSQVFQQQLKTYFSANMVLPGVHLIDPNQVIAAPVADDGQVLTLERRQQIAASRPALNFDDPTQDFRNIGAIEQEPMGTSAEKAQRQTIIIAKAKQLELPELEGNLVHGD